MYACASGSARILGLPAYCTGNCGLCRFLGAACAFRFVCTLGLPMHADALGILGFGSCLGGPMHLDVFVFCDCQCTRGTCHD